MVDPAGITMLAHSSNRPPPTKESIKTRPKAGFRARGRNKRMTGAGNQKHAETVGGVSIISAAQL